MARGQGRYDHEKWAREQVREEERRKRAEVAAARAAERERKLEDDAVGKTEAERLNAELAGQVDRLESILTRGLNRRAKVDLNALVRHDELPPLDLGSRASAPPRPAWRDFQPSAPGVIGGLFGGKARHERHLAAAREDFERAELDYNRAESVRQRWVQEQRSRHEVATQAHQAEVAEHNTWLAGIAAGLQGRDRESVQAYLELTLTRVPLPEGLPHQAEVAYSPRGEQAVVRFELPTVDAVPTVAGYTYVSTTEQLREKARPSAQIAQLYRSVVSQIALLYMRDLFEADPELDNVELGGHVHSTNPATGQREYPCLISVAVDRETYSGLNLRDVRPDVCLRHLNALVSHHPHLVEAITPVRDFDLARYSFVEGVDVVASLDSRPDLTKMTSTEFEHFVRQLFEARGLEGWTTERTGDDGVDAVVINRDPMVGGLTIVQAKKYNHVLGVNHIRELVGAMDEKRAGRAILVTIARQGSPNPLWSWIEVAAWFSAYEPATVPDSGPLLSPGFLAEVNDRLDLRERRRQAPDAPWHPELDEALPLVS